MVLDIVGKPLPNETPRKRNVPSLDRNVKTIMESRHRNAFNYPSFSVTVAFDHLF